MTGFQLKIIAILAMVVDHLGAIFFPDQLWMRFIGRITFPIMAYFIVEGFHYTRNFKRYLGTMVFFALLTEIPFDLALFGQPFSWGNQNVLWTFVIGLLTLKASEWLQSKNPWLSLLAVFGGIFLADFVATDYSGLGVMLILLMYHAKSSGNPNRYIALMLIFWALVEWIGTGFWPFWGLILPIPLILCYNGEYGVSRENKIAKYLFYLFYPAHLAFIAGIAIMMA